MNEENYEGPGSHGEKDIDVRFIAKFALIFIAFTFAVFYGAWIMYGALRSHERSKDAPPVTLVPPRQETADYPLLQDGVKNATPADEVRAWKQIEQERVQEYGWVDREKGIVRMPVSRAMTLLAQRGLPSREAVEGTPKIGSNVVDEMTDQGLGSSDSSGASGATEHSAVEEH